MTTEGDGNYQLQRFLEGEGAEADIQLVTAWLLYMVWEAKHDTNDRKDLRGADTAKYGLGGKGPLRRREEARRRARRRSKIVRGLFQTFAHADGPLRLPPAGHGRDRRDQPRVLQQRSPRRRRPHGGRQAHHERRARRRRT